MEKEVSRRGFLLGMGAAGVAVAGAGLAACAPQQQASSGSTSAGSASSGGNSTSAAQSNGTVGTMTSEQSLKKWSFEIPPDPIPDSKIVETIQADVIVLGAGTAGLVTANSAMDQGLSVCLVSASSRPVSRGGSNHAVMSKTKQKYNLPIDDLELFKREINNNGLFVDQKKWYKFYNHSEEAMNWLIDIMESKGYETSLEQSPMLLKNGNFFSQPGAHGWMTPEAHTTGMNQQFVVDELAERLEAGGNRIFFDNIGRQLVRENNNTGRVTAVIAERDNGSFAKYVGTKAIVLATGDFSTNREMMYKYAPQTAVVVSDALYDEETNYNRGFEYGGLYPGDGQRMGLWIGAAWQRIWPCAPMGGGIGVGPGNRTMAYSGLKVNKFGARFCDEYGFRDMAAYVNRYEGSPVFAIWNQDYATKFPFPWMDGTIPHGTDNTISHADVIKGWETSVERGNYVKADTVEEVIQKLELPAETIETVRRYNELCKAGYDSDFHKDSSLMISLENGPFYGAKSGNPMILTILGGLRTNVNMQVCDEDDHPIEGLYNVGTMVGDMYGVNYTFEIPGLNLGATAVTFGYMLGKFLATAK